ncbi:hypothetical protein [Rhizobium sp. NLR22b]|uniref:hypothetical protein n=1 Tax=Rhizobium sp. NLR22b TaxID=2731115 RepID=UPI001C8301A1|nr:hypothetical protein [Rhizobium sp. NLR22b]MBX5240956.1 hypothetical protein [Rhizobium sp. NLR22b]
MLNGTSEEMEQQARKLTDAQLAELAGMNDSPVALKARGEIARRNSETGKATLFWAKVAAWVGILAVVLSVIGLIISWR